MARIPSRRMLLEAVANVLRELAEARKLNPDRHMSIAREQAGRVFAVPKVRALFAPLISPVCGKPF